VRPPGPAAAPVEGDDGLLLHTGRLDGCAVDPAAGVATVGAGCVWQDVLDAAAPHGRLPLVGSAPGVGVVGFLTGGGIGPMARTFGPSSDHVRAFEVVTGQGDVLRATPDQHADLYWGLRGGKGTLGIVTAVEIDLPAPDAVHGGALWFDGADAGAVLRAWRDWGRDLPEHASTSIALMQLPPLPGVPEPLAGRLTVAVRYVSVADVATAEAALAPMRAAAAPLLDGVGPLPTAALASVHADPVDPMPTHEGSALLGELPDDAIDALLAVAGPGSGSVQAMVELRLLGGAIARPRHPGALCHREAALNLMCVGVLAPPVAELVPSHTATVLRATAPWATGGLLPNFAASADPATVARCYDEDARHWLAALAEQYDPAGVLRIGQVVRTDGGASC
jgi:FAD/FMN-containing dehydrogenase